MAIQRREGKDLSSSSKPYAMSCVIIVIKALLEQ